MPSRARMTTTSVIASAAVVAVATFGLGFVLSYDSGGGPDEVAVATTSTTERAAPTTERRASTTARPTTTTTLPPTTLPTTVLTTLPTTVTTAGPTTTTTIATPGRLVVTYPQDATGRMSITAGGSSGIILQNDGGSRIEFRLQSSGAVTLSGVTSLSGILSPGQVTTVPVIASPNPPPGDGPHGTVAVFTLAGLVESIQVVIHTS